MSIIDTKTIEIRYLFWRLMRYLAIAAAALALCVYLIVDGHWALALLGWIGLPLAAVSVADALWRFVCRARGPDMILSPSGITVYGAHIPWSAIYYTTAKRELGMSTIELHFFPGAGDHLELDFSGRIARWTSRMADVDGLMVSAFALEIEHDDLVALIDAYRAHARRALNGSAGSSPLDAPA